MRLKQMAAVTALAVGALACNAATSSVEADNSSQADRVVQPQKIAASDTPPISVKDAAKHSSTQASKSKLGPEYKDIAQFVDFRKKLIADGWKPVVNPKCHEAVLGPFYERLCKAHQESVSCRVCEMVPELVGHGGGVGDKDGYNAMHYIKDGTPLSVTTHGDFRGLDAARAEELIVVGWEYTTSTDAIPLN